MIPKIKNNFRGERGISKPGVAESLPALSPHPKYLPALDLSRMLGCSANTIRNWNLPFEYDDVERFRFSAGYGTSKKRVKVFSVMEAVAHAKKMGR